MAHQEVPESLKIRLLSAGGINRFGEPNFRVVWGEDRETWIGGEWVDTDDSGNELRRVAECRKVPKYVPNDRWYLEKWMPPEHYGSPEAWDKYQVEVVDGESIPALGPYPSRGEYEMCYCLQHDGEFAPLEPAAIEEIVRMIRTGEAASRADNRAAIFRKEEKRAKDYDNFCMDVLNDDNAFARSGHIYVPRKLVSRAPRKQAESLTPQETKAIRYMDMRARVKSAAKEAVN